MLVALLLNISHMFLVLYPVNVNGGVVQNDDSNRTQILGGDWLVDFLKKSNEFEDEQNWTKRELLIQLHKIYQEIYELRGELYNQFLSVVPYVKKFFCTILSFGLCAFSAPPDLETLANFQLGCPIP